MHRHEVGRKPTFVPSSGVSLLLAGMCVLAAGTTSFAACTGDCDGDSAVITAELVTCVGIGLSSIALAECPECAGGDERVEVTDLIGAVAGSLGACPTPTPTSQATATPTSTPTATDSATPTATLTVSETPTPTDTMPSATPTSTPTPRPALGERFFSIVEPMGGLGATVEETRSGLFSTGLAGNNVAITFQSQGLILAAGSPNEDGIAPLRLFDTVVVAVGNPVAVLCLRLRAESSTGEIDCDGGSAYGVRLSQAAGADAPPAVLETGLGAGTGTAGAAMLLVQQEALQLPAGSTREDCAAAEGYGPPVFTAYTTGVATATKGGATLSVGGEHFDCARFRQSDGSGMLVSPSVAFSQLPPGDIATVLRLADAARPPAGVCGNGTVDARETCDDGGFCFGDSANIACETNHPNCPDGRECIDRICLCRDDQECESGHSCVEGHCVLGCTASEDCPSGLCRPAGGDGCAANCTAEDVRTTRLVTAMSPSRIQTTSIAIHLNLSAGVQLVTGQMRDEPVLDPQGHLITQPGEIPVAVEGTGAVFDPIRVPGLVCACVRHIPVPEVFGPGNSGAGRIGCGAEGLTDIDYKIVQDHNTNPGDPNNGATPGLAIPQLPNDPPCFEEHRFLDGLRSHACRELSGDPPCNDPTSFFHPNVCNSPRLVQLSGGPAPRGSAFIDRTIGVGLLADNGMCRTDRPMVNGQCQFRDYGPDCLPCTPDDADHGTQEYVPATTGTAKGAVYDAGNVITPGFTFPVPIDEGNENACANNAQCRPHEQCRRSCEGSGFPCTSNADCAFGDCRASARCEVQCGGIVRCMIDETGTPFDCDALLSNPTGGLSGGALAVTSPDIDSKRIGDNVTASILAFE